MKPSNVVVTISEVDGNPRAIIQLTIPGRFPKSSNWHLQEETRKGIQKLLKSAIEEWEMGSGV